MFEQKINNQQAEDIRDRISRGTATQVELAREYRVHRGTIHRILRGNKKPGGQKKRQGRVQTSQSRVYNAFIEEILVQMRVDTFNTLCEALDHIADDPMRIRMNKWSRTHARLLILEASEAFRELLLNEIENLFQEPEPKKEE